jgi:sugar O-acyltransferase (sialic acid O-acetyltransferase NeuD family)
MANKIILLGGGGHCKSVLSAIDRSAYVDIIIVDRPGMVGQVIDGIPVAATDDDLPDLLARGYTQAIITLGSVSANHKRRKLYDLLTDLGFTLATVVDPSATVAATATLGAGVFVGKGAIINAGAIIGSQAIINTGAIVEHDCQIGEFVHLAPGVVLCGMVTIEADVHIGAGSCVMQERHIGTHTTIGMGSVVVRDIPANCVAFGNPCKKVKDYA